MEPTEYRAAVFHGPHRAFEIAQQRCPRLGDGEVLVRVLMCTLCGSDLHSFAGSRSVPCPSILGHEILGEVISLGSGREILDARGAPLESGDRVTWTIAASCGDCFYCRRGVPQKCDSLFKYGHESSSRHPLSGGLADVCLLRRGTAIFKVAASLPDEVACPANCATATVAAALRAAGSCQRATVLVQGAGMLGLTACAMAQHLGAGDTIVSDIDPRRLEMAPIFGAAEAVDVSAGPEGLREVVLSRTEGRGVDLALELSGSNAAVASAMELLRVCGKLVLVGTVFPAPPLPLSTETVVRRQLSLTGVHNYAPRDLSMALDFLEGCRDRYPFASLVSKRFALHEVEAAFRFAAGERVFRVAVTP